MIDKKKIPKRGDKEGQGFNDQRGEFEGSDKVEKHNGQNVNNDGQGIEEREKEKAARR